MRLILFSSLALTLVLTGCGGDDDPAPVASPSDTASDSSQDGGGTDSGSSDASSSDVEVDATPEDTTVEDTDVQDTAVEDATGQDTSTADVTIADATDTAAGDAADAATEDTADAVAEDVLSDAPAGCQSSADCAEGVCDLATGDCVECLVITVEEGAQTIPMTNLHASASLSSAVSGTIAEHAWSLTQPDGSKETLLPNSSSETVSVTARFVGQYTFSLTVFGENGEALCPETQAVVDVLPDKEVHIELFWSAPNDPDPTDLGPGAGPDLDLHLLNPYAAPGMDGWFTEGLDCWLLHPELNWGSAGNSEDDVKLITDSPDGATLEAISLGGPEEMGCCPYRIGVYTWDDHGFGASLATVRVYINKQLAWESEPKELYNDDFWEVAELSWPDGVITPLENVVSDFDHAIYPSP